MKITKHILMFSLATAAAAFGCERDLPRTGDREATTTRGASPAASPYDNAGERAGAAGERMGERAEAAGDRMGDRAEGAANRMGDHADDAEDRAEAAKDNAQDQADTAQARAEAAAAPADNTEKNKRDRDPNSLTAGDQKENETDLNITQKVRQDVVGHDALSMTAKNVKIITMDGVVTLKGPVKSDTEKREIASIAQRVAGVKRVDNQLEVASK